MVVSGPAPRSSLDGPAGPGAFYRWVIDPPWLVRYAIKVATVAGLAVWVTGDWGRLGLGLVRWLRRAAGHSSE